MLAKYGLCADVDTHALALLCSLYAEYIKLSALVEQDGPTVDDQGTERSNPIYRLWLALGSQLLAVMKEFGMSPRARTGLMLQVPEPDNAKARFFRPLATSSATTFVCALRAFVPGGARQSVERP